MPIRDDWQSLAEAPRFVVFDTETTGLDPLREELLEIGAVMVAGENIIASLSLMIRPSKPIPEEAANVNNISDAMVAQALDAHEALACFEFFIANYPLVAHNAQFDIAFVQAALGYVLPNQIYCTSSMARAMLPRQERFSLSALCRRFNIENNQAHRALSDAEATARIALALLQLGQNPPAMRSFAVCEQNTYTIREALKRSGFRWSAAERAWQISLTEAEIGEAITAHGDAGIKIFGFLCKEIS